MEIFCFPKARFELVYSLCMNMHRLEKLHPGDKVAVLSPSFAAPGMFPEVFELGLKRLRDVFHLEPVEFPTTRKLGATTDERTRDLIEAFERKEIKAVIASIGGDDQVTYIKNLPAAPFIKNPKPFFGYSDNTHFANFLWLNGIPSFYGGSVMNQCAMQMKMDEFTVRYMEHALFESGECELTSSDTFNEIGLDWSDVTNLQKQRSHEKNDGWYWDGVASAQATTWGGCVESIDELLRHGNPIPSLEEFGKIVLMVETSEEIPPAPYVRRVFRALGERGILERIQGVFVGRAKAWEFDKQNALEQRHEYREAQRAMILKIVRAYNKNVPIVQGLDFGHTDPQIPMPYGSSCRIDGASKRVFVEF